MSGGLGGIGRSLGHWMVQQGAKNLVFLSRSGSTKPESKKAIEELSDKGARVTAYSCDVGNAEEVQEVLRQCSQEFPPIRGVIQGAMVLKVSRLQSNLIWATLTTLPGRNFSKYDPRPVHGCNPTKSQRQLEPSPVSSQRP